MREGKNIACISSMNKGSASLIFTEDYIVIKGIHYNIYNWSIKKRKHTVSILKNDIQDIEFVTIYSKRLILCFALVVSAFFALGKKLFDCGRMVIKSGRIDFSNKIFNKLMGSLLKNLRFVSVIIITGFILWLLLCIILALAYYFHSYRILRITFSGGMVGVETKYYDKMQLNNLVTCWKTNGTLFCADS